MHRQRYSSDAQLSCLQSSIDSLNLLTKADNDTIEFCFDKIVEDVFHGKRNLLKDLLTPTSQMSKNNKTKIPKIQINQIADIFRDRFHQLILDREQNDPMKQAQEPEQEQEVEPPSFTNIAREIQIQISSFLDFKSINITKNVSRQIASVMIGELLKMDIDIINIHELINNNASNNGLTIANIFAKASKTFRICKNDKFKQFVDDQLKMKYDSYNDILCFKYTSGEASDFVPRSFRNVTDELSEGTTFSEISKFKQNWRNEHERVQLVLINKKLIYCHSSNATTSRSLVPLFVQQFDVEKQELKIKDVIIVPNGPYVLPDDTFAATFNDFRKYIKNKNNLYDYNNVIKFYWKCHQMNNHYLRNQECDDNVTIFFANLVENNNERIATWKINTNSLIYEIENENVNLLQLKAKFNDEYEPFYEDINDFCQSHSQPGLGYNLLGLELCQKNDPSEEILDCFKKAFDLNPNNSVFCWNYIDTMLEIGEEKTAQKLCLQKLKEFEEGTFKIRNNAKYKFLEIMAKSYRWSDDVKECLKYYQKATEQIESLVEEKKSYRHQYQLGIQLPRSPVLTELNDDLCHMYENIAELYENEYETLDVGVEKYEEYFNKIMNLQPTILHYYCNRYAFYLERNLKYESAFHYLSMAIKLSTSTNADVSLNSVIRYHLNFACCCTKMSRFKMAEQKYLELITIIKKSDESDSHSDWLASTYGSLAKLYEEKLNLNGKALIYYEMKMAILSPTKYNYIDQKMEYSLFLERINKTNECIDNFEQALHEMGDHQTFTWNWNNYRMQYIALLHKYKMNEKVKQFHQTIMQQQFEKKNHKLFHQLSLFYVERKNNDLFVDCKNKCFQLIKPHDGTYNRYLIEYAKHYQQHNEWKQCLFYFEEVIANLKIDDDNYVKYNLKYIDCLSKMDQNVKAQNILTSLKKLFPNNNSVLSKMQTNQQ